MSEFQEISASRNSSISDFDFARPSILREGGPLLSRILRQGGDFDVHDPPSLQRIQIPIRAAEVNRVPNHNRRRQNRPHREQLMHRDHHVVIKEIRRGKYDLELNGPIRVGQGGRILLRAVRFEDPSRLLRLKIDRRQLPAEVP